MWSLIILIVVALPAGEKAEFRAELNRKFATEALCEAAIPTAAEKSRADYARGDVPFLNHILEAAGQTTFTAMASCASTGTDT